MIPLFGEQLLGGVNERSKEEKEAKKRKRCEH